MNAPVKENVKPEKIQAQTTQEIWEDDGTRGKTPPEQIDIYL